jgi:hypothetical protein
MTRREASDWNKNGNDKGLAYIYYQKQGRHARDRETTEGPTDRGMNRQHFLRRAALLAAVLALFVAARPAGLAQSKDEISRSLSEDVTILLSPEWVALGPEQSDPPAALALSAPPVRFNQVMALQNPRTHAILKLATTNNLLLGHDAYWLDGQLHSANNSGMSLPDFLFYLFFPPPYSCLEAGSDSYSGAGRGTGENGQTTDLQVYFDCKYSPTLTDFYSAQVSSRVTFQKNTEDTLHAVGDMGEFDLMPMEQADSSGMTFFVFEALGRKKISPDTMKSFSLPENLSGAQADYFWAIGSKSPFPFQAEPGRKDPTIVQVAYAGVGPNRRPEFMQLLQKIHAK